MASIKLKGDTSGEITISAPAVAGTNTLTLPAHTGTVITSVTAAADVPAPTKLSTASGSAPSYSARAWVNFDGGTTPVIGASGNVSSVTYVATGVYGITLSTAIQDDNYAITNCGWNNNQNIIAQEDAADTQRTTSYFQVVYETAGASKVNSTYNSVTVFR